MSPLVGLIVYLGRYAPARMSWWVLGQNPGWGSGPLPGTEAMERISPSWRYDLSTPSAEGVSNVSDGDGVPDLPSGGGYVDLAA
jgi:hypothetical protein